MTDCPTARREGLTVEAIDHETLVYDAADKRAHCLNRAAALVWGYCDGETTVTEMAARLAADTGGPVDEDIVRLALRDLGERGLLAQAAPVPSAAALDRRQLLVRLGAAAAVMVPVITSLVAPSSAAAQSGSSSSGSAAAVAAAAAAAAAGAVAGVAARADIRAVADGR